MDFGKIWKRPWNLLRERLPSRYPLIPPNRNPGADNGCWLFFSKVLWYAFKSWLFNRRRNSSIWKDSQERLEKWRNLWMFINIFMTFSSLAYRSPARSTSCGNFILISDFRVNKFHNLNLTLNIYSDIYKIQCVSYWNPEVSRFLAKSSIFQKF